MGSSSFLRLSNPTITSQGKCSFLKEVALGVGWHGSCPILRSSQWLLSTSTLLLVSRSLSRKVVRGPECLTLPRGNLPFLGGQVCLTWKRLLLICGKLQLSQHKISYAVTQEELSFSRSDAEGWIVSLPEEGRDPIYVFDQHFRFTTPKFC